MAVTLGSAESVFGPYRLEVLLGSGGMGEVYRAYDTGQDRVVALKLLHRHLADDEEYRERFRRESKTTARLREPHVIPIHRYGEVDGRLFIDMRLVEGEDLRTVLARRGRLSPAEAVGVVSQLARAVDAAHAEGLVHRDIKPSNVLCSTRDAGAETDFVYLVDFGIARPLDGGQRDLTSTGAAPGTIAYMAPERFGVGGAGRSADVYALACVLHECLTGARPFDVDDLPAMISAHLHAAPPAPSSRGVPEGFDAVIARGMAKEPGQRYATAGELAAAARAALPAAAPADPNRTAPIPLPGFPTAPRRAVLAALGVLALVGAVALVVLLPGPRTTAGTALAVGSPTVAAPDTPTNQPAAEQDLLARLPPGFVPANCHAVADPTTAGALATIGCVPGAADSPDHLEIVAYQNEPSVTDAFETYAGAHQIMTGPPDNQCHTGGNARTTWQLGTADNTPQQGALGCYRDGRGAHLAWTDTTRFVLYVADRADGDGTKLYQWWTTT